MSAPTNKLLEEWKSLAMRAIDCLHDVERETEWGQPTFGPTVWGRLAAEQNDLLGPDAEANAHLIAAAPDLYEALESVPTPSRTEPWDRFEERMNVWLNGPWRSAIAKARGEA